jgi:hypothetical protein
LGLLGLLLGLRTVSKPSKAEPLLRWAVLAVRARPLSVKQSWRRIVWLERGSGSR